MERLCFHTVRLESKILEEVGSEKSEAGEDKVREKFVYTARMGNDTKFVYLIVLYAMPALKMKGYYVIKGAKHEGENQKED